MAFICFEIDLFSGFWILESCQKGFHTAFESPERCIAVQSCRRCPVRILVQFDIKPLTSCLVYQSDSRLTMNLPDAFSYDFMMGDLERDAGSSGNFQCLLHRLHNFFPLIPHMCFIKCSIRNQLFAKLCQLIHICIAARRIDQTTGHGKSPVRKCLTQ